MSIYIKASGNADIINGIATVFGGKFPSYRSDFRDMQTYASGDSLVHFENLDSRFLVPPSGWNE